jgi:hypothetical protein
LKNTPQANYTYIKKISSLFLQRKSFLFFISIILVSISACKEEDPIGLLLLPENDQLSTVYSDTSTVVTSTQLEDSLRTDEVSVQLLGQNNDPVFGTSIANVYTQVYLQGTPAFGVQPTTDSLILILDYSGYYGDTLSDQTIEVFRLTEDLHPDSSYYSNRNFQYEPAALGTLTFKPKPNTRVSIDSLTTYEAQIRIPLSNTLGDSILALGGSSTLSSNASWVAYFKGLFLKASMPNITEDGAISYLNFFNSKLSLYFTDSSNAKKVYDFSLNGARLNQFSHDYTGTDVGNQLASPSFTDTVNYIQSMAGVKTKVNFPFLKHFLDSGNILLNRAELKVFAETAVPPYALPQRLLLVTENANGDIIFPIDYYETSGYYGGALNSSGDGYVFNIARHLQQYLNGTVTSGDFYLIVSGAGVEATRTIIKSGNNPNLKMSLSVYYTKFY